MTGSSGGSRRPLVIYLIAVVGPTLIVLTFGLVASRRQDEAAAALRLTTARLQEERIADDVVSGLKASAAEVLADPSFRNLASLLSSPDPAAVDAGRALVPEIRSRYPVVRDVFVIADNRVRYPRVTPPLPHPLEDWLGEEPDGRGIRLSALFARAQAAESAGRFDSSVRDYQRAAALAKSRKVQALALAAVARAKARSGDSSGAIDVLEVIATGYTDTYTLNERPQAVVAVMEIARLGGAHRKSDIVAAVVSALLEGRWSVTPEQCAHFMETLARDVRAERCAIGTPAFVQVLATAFRLPVSLEAHEVGTMVLGPAPNPQQVFYAAGPFPGTVAGITANLDWVRLHVLPTAAARIAPEREVRVGPASSERTPFQGVIPFWGVSVTAGRAQAERRYLPVLAYALGAGMVVTVLMLGVVLLARDVARETRLNRLRADLVGGVSHDLKTPLSVIRVYAETVEKTDGMPAPDRRWFASGIVQETERLRRVIDDVIDFSRIQQGERSYRLSPGSLVAPVRAATDRFKAYADLHNFAVETVIPAGLPAVRRDPAAVEQAVLNLLDNALKYSGESKRATLRLYADGQMVAVVVEDEGIGISNAEQVRVFDRFQRGTDPAQGGYGLGLYLVRHIMQAHGGTVDVQSAPGVGSAFRLRFPVMAVDHENAETIVDRG